MIMASHGVILKPAYAVITTTMLTPSYHALTLDGKDFSIQEYRGNAVLLYTWATWCEPYRSEIPYLQSLYKNFSSQGLWN